MSQRRAILATGIGATVLGVVLLAAVLWQQRSDRRIDRSPVTQDSTVMIGDSITQQGPWRTTFAESSIVNQGYSGFTTEQLVGIARDVAAKQPQTVYLLTGTNDIRDGHPPEWTVRYLTQILDELRSASPDTRVIIQTILPRADKVNEVRATNRMITQLAEQRGIEVLDLYPEFDNGFGALRDGETVDGLHLNDEGNDRWARVLRGHLEDG